MDGLRKWISENQGMAIVIAVVAIAVIVAAIVLVSNSNAQRDADATATAQAEAEATVAAEADAEATAAAEAEAEAAAAAEAEVVEVTFWHMEQPPHRVARVQELIDEFNEAHPGIVIKQEPQNWAEIYVKAPAAVAAGNAPELLFAIPDFTPIIRAAGAVQPVDDFVAEMDEAHGFFASAVEPYSYDGQVWAVPLWNMAHSLWYHKDVFEEAGIEPPTTWSEWLAAVEALTSDGQHGLGLPANRHLYTDQTTYDFMINTGASEIYNEDGTLRFDNEQTVRAFDFYNQLYQFSPADSPNWTWGEAEACFNSGTCASVLQFTVITTYDTQGAGDPETLGVIAIPHDDELEESGTIAYVNGVMVLTDDPEKQEAAYEWLRFILEPENYGRFLNMEPGLYIPVTEDGGEAESYWEDELVVKYRDQIEVMVENSRNGMLFGFTEGNIFPSIAQISAQNLLSQTLQRLVLEGEDPAEAVTWGQEQMMEAIED